MYHFRRITHRRTAPSSKFPLFSSLPPELRVQIWELICRFPRTLQIYPTSLKSCPHGAICRNCYAYYRYLSNLPPPAIMSVNTEAREVALQKYQLDFGTISKWRGWRRVIWSPPRIYVNWEVDEVKVLAVTGTRGMDVRGEKDKFGEMEVKDRSPIRWLMSPEGERAIRIGLLAESCDNGEGAEIFECPFYQG